MRVIPATVTVANATAMNALLLNLTIKPASDKCMATHASPLNRRTSSLKRTTTSLEGAVVNHCLLESPFYALMDAQDPLVL
ncbi:hypothetical protein SeMB42_g00346 [Synchytrium endobioticum]|uniref:Uncharacterized protein n=1 Tax=Synchytrium endobioticum TaxID=286115 RepID=A0A507DSS0_9FUNG|nr:hypothetical protein SeMB42_g00346 [Synchytrium endobioticum]